MVRQPQRLIDIVSHQHNRASQQTMNADHLLLQGFARHRIERAEGFIHQQHFRVGRQRARHADALLLAAGKLMRVAFAQARLQPQQGHQLIDPRLGLLPRPLLQLRDGGNVLRHRPVGEQADGLDGVAHPAAQFEHRLLANILPGETDRPAVVLHQAINHLQRGRLPRAGGANQHRKCPLAQMQIEVFHRRLSGKGFIDAVELNHGPLLSVMRPTARITHPPPPPARWSG